MYNAQEAAGRIKTKAKEKNVLIKDMLEECELSKNAISSMLSRGSWLQANNLAKIADYLECSVDYLLGRTDIQEVEPSIRAPDSTSKYITTTNDVETTLLIEFRSLNTQGQEYIMQTMDMVKDKYKKSYPVSKMEIG